MDNDSTMWVVDPGSDKFYTYDLNTKELISR